MNASRALALAAAALALAGSGLLTACSSFREIPLRTQQRLSGVAVRTADAPGEARDVYERARAALAPIGFRYERGGPAQGYLEALSGLGGADRLNSSSQRKLVATFGVGALPGTTRVDLTITEIVEENSRDRAGFGTEMPIRDTPLYEVFFRALGVNEATTPLPTTSPSAGVEAAPGR